MLFVRCVWYCNSVVVSVAKSEVWRVFIALLDYVVSSICELQKTPEASYPHHKFYADFYPGSALRYNTIGCAVSSARLWSSGVLLAWSWLNVWSTTHPSVSAGHEPVLPLLWRSSARWHHHLVLLSFRVAAVLSSAMQAPKISNSLFCKKAVYCIVSKRSYANQC